MPIQQIKQARPEWSTLSDDQIVDMVHQLDYPDLSREQVAKGLGVKLAPPAAAPMPDRSIPAFLNDQAINIGNSAAGIVKTGVDFFAPDSALSKGIGDFIQSGQDMQSDKQKRLNADLQTNLQAADGPLAKAGAYVKHAVLADPSKTVSDTVGNFGPFMGVGKVAQAAKLGEAGASALSMGVAGVSGAGEVRGNIYDKINSTPDADLLIQSPEYYDLRVNQGMSEKAAKSAIGADLSRNLPEVAAAGAMGALSGKFGVEGMAAKVAPKTGRLASAGIGFLDEATQGGIEQLTTNVGVQRAIPTQGLGEDIPLNMAMEGLPGLLGGSMHGGHAPKLPDNGPLSRAANTALGIQHQEAQQMLALPAPTIQVTPGGTAVTSNQRGDLIQQGLDAHQGGIFDITPVPEAPGEAPKVFQGPQEQIDQSRANIEAWGQRAAPLPLEQAQGYKAQFAERGQDVTVIPHPAGEGFTVVPSAWLAPFMRNDSQQAPLAGMLPGPDMAAPGAPLVAGAAGVRPQTYGDQAQSRAIQAAQEEEAARKEAVGLTPDVERAQSGRSAPAVEAPRVSVRVAPLPIGFDNSPTGRMVAGPGGVVAETQADRINREHARKVRPGDRLNPAGNPFKNKHAANLEQKRAGGEVIPVDGGWVVRPTAQTVEASNGITGDTAGLSANPGDAGQGDDGASMGVSRPAADGAGQLGDLRAGVDGQPVERDDAGRSGAVADGGGLIDVQNAPQAAGVPADAKPAKPAKPKAADARGTGQDGAGQPAGGVPAAGRVAAQADGVNGKAPLFTRKRLPDMTDDELTQAQAFYGPDHKRTEKIAKELAKRGINAPAGQEADAQAAPPKLAGDKLDGEWTAFHKDSGTLSIPRAEMPQVRAEHRGALVNFLNARGIEHEQDEVPADSLKPTQAEFSPAKVQKAKDFTGGDRSILVSQDGHVVDGHHQWVAKHEAGEPVKVIRLKAPIKEVLDQVKEFPSAEQDQSSAQATEQQDDAQAAPLEQAAEVSPQAIPGGSQGEEAGGSQPAPVADYSKRSVDWLRQNGGETITVKEALDALTAKQRTITDDKANWTPRDEAGHPVSGVNLYTSDAVQKLDKISWAITNLMDHQKKHGEGKAGQPADPAKKTEPLPKTIEKMNAKNGEGLTDADRVPEKKPASKTPTLDMHTEAIKSVREGKASVDEYRAAFEAMTADPDAIKTELMTMSKEALLRAGGVYFYQRNKQDTKPEIVARMYDMLVNEYAMGKDYGPTGYFMGEHREHKRKKAEALRALVEGQTPETLAEFAGEVAESVAEAEAEGAARKKAIENPQTLEDFRASMTAKLREGKTRRDAYLSLTVEQRTKYDELEAESTRESREARKRAAKTEVRAAGQATGGDIVATKHTRDGHDLWVVRLSDRLSTEDYKTVLASAKRMGGSYSSFRGNGAVPGFQFRTPDAAQAFLKLAGGDTSAAKDLAEQRRDSFEDDRSQSAVERLREMADKIDDSAQEALDRDRKTNTARRARFAASADREAQQAKALAKTMRNIADAIEGGGAKFLDAVRTKTQVEMLRSQVAMAKDAELRAKHTTYAEQEKRRGEPATAETADFAEFPMFTAFRSDLASLARQMIEVDGTKKMGQQLMSVADDVTDAYIEFAKKPENLYKLSTFSIRQGDDVKAAIFPSKDAAERAIRRSGLSDRAIVLAEKRGVNRIIMSPSEAMSRGVWTGDGDKRITLTGDAGAALVEAIGRRSNKTNRLSVPWQFQTAYDRRNALKRIGIETASEFRSALREFIGLQERAIVNKVREMELAMTGRKNDGLDFFPTPAEVADQMVAAADIGPDMAVLEPSAGMGHIADRIRETGAEPEVIELDEDRRNLLQEKGYYLQPYRDFMEMEPRKFFTFGDVMRAPDGTEGIMHGGKGWSGRASLHTINDDGSEGRFIGWFDRDELVGVRHRGFRGNDAGGYDRIVMNPPFSNGRDIEHVMHAYELLKPGGRIVAIMGESAFFNQSKKAEGFRQWLDDKGGTSEKLPAGSFMDPSLPVNTGVNARMVVIDKSEALGASPDNQAETGFSRNDAIAAIAHLDMVDDMVAQLTKGWKNAPQVEVLRSMDDAPDSVRQENDRQKAGGATGEPEGFFHKGKVYLMAGHMRTMADVRRVVFHEALGHLGLRGLYGADLAPILDQVWNARRRDVQAKAKAYGLNVENVRDRRLAAEEWLAEIAQTNPSMGFVKRAVAAIRGWLRRNVPSLADLPMTDDEVIREFILPAQRFIKEGPGGDGLKLAPAFKRDDAGMARAAGLGSTINVDGKERPTTNSNGQSIHPTEEGIRNFWRWFGDSKVVDGQGRPLVVFHGTKAAISSFDPARTGEASDAGYFGTGIYFAQEADVSSGYTKGAGAIYPVNLAISKPYEWKGSLTQRVKQAQARGGARAVSEVAAGKDSSEASWYGNNLSQVVSFSDVRLPADIHGAVLSRAGITQADLDAIAVDKGNFGPEVTKLRNEYTRKLGESLTQELAARGHDGIKVTNPITGRTLVEWVAFKPTQIKSATGNRGTFNPEDANIGFSRTAAAHTYAEQARNAFSDFVGSAGAEVDWLDKSLKTQYAKAQKFPEFGKVFNKLQEYIEGVSSMANQAADQAPSILPKLDKFSDLWKHGGILGHGLSKADREAVAAPIFEGTLEWTRDEDGKLVRVDDLANADEMTPGVVFSAAELREKFGLNDTQIGQYQEFRKAVNESLDQVVSAEIARLIPGLPANITAMAQTSEGRQQMQSAVEEFLGGEDHPQWAAVQEKYTKAEALKDRGYAPLSRFGKHFVHVVQDGETKFFGLEESVYKANGLARDLRQEFKGATVEQGVISQEQYKLMSAVPLDAMELFAEALGAEKSEVFQQYIQLAKNNRSTMKRLIHRKGTAGFSQDVPRVLANFITSNARASSAALHVKGAKDLAQGIRQGDVKDEAVKLIGAVTEPEESGAAVRGMMFTNFIGGSIASAVVNLTQPVMMTMPYLSQWGGGVKASARLIAAAKMAVTRKGGDDALNAALKRAEDDGIVAPQEIHHLIQRAVGGMADKNPVLQKLAFVWGAPFSLAESFNRRATFIAAFQTAREEGIADPFGFAEKAVVETQGIYNAGMKPNAARGIAGATAMTFKQYSIHYLEWLARMAKAGPQGKRAAVLALVMLMLAAGADGLPFMDDLDDVIDTGGQAMGYDTNTKRWRHKAIADVLGDELGEVASRGFSAAGGMPIDVSVRMGMGNLIPASDLLMKSNTDTARSLAELAGAGGGLFTQYRDAVRLLLDGDVAGGLMKVAPVALQNAGKAAQMADSGEYRDSRGRKVVDVGAADVGAKLLGFQPAEVARESSRLADMRQSETLAKLTESEITDKWARAIADGDKAAEGAALAMRDDWNEKNPEAPIVVKRSQAVKKARQLAMDRKGRFLKTVGKERRAAAKQEMES